MSRFALTPASSALLVIDVQERFLPAIPAIGADAPSGLALAALVAGAQLLNVPTLISEQYPKGLGATLPHVLPVPSPQRHAKTHFSCLDDAALAAAIAGLHRQHVVVCGIEAHVCVLATVADLLANGADVVVAADAVASRKEAHRDHALAAMRDLGALVLPVESILFRWQRQAGVGVFKTLSALVK